MKYHDHLSIQELWALILLGLDVLHDAVQSSGQILSATDHTTLSGSLAALREEGPIGPGASNHIGQAANILEAAVCRETLGHQNVFDGTHDPELGAVGQVKSAPILSSSGAELESLLRHFRQLLAMRELLTARVDSELQLARLKAF
ncbi:hypothetical protein ACFSUD_09470 [Sulfitobacter aestuarii]|uniref:Uncharacterized protein n=1 Tax=Sulfitobacter aestuarii TaxID=2161676 RepID=A0ABW5U3Q3_9RHOB